jgi:predicted nucleic acid-binding protein
VLTLRGENLYFTFQNLVEFWNVCTRPAAKNGFGLNSAQMETRAKLIEESFELLPDNERAYDGWRRLVLDYSVAGSQVHDARIVAAMISHGVTRLLTLNDRDFRRYPQISVVHPRDVGYESK